MSTPRPQWLAGLAFAALVVSPCLLATSPAHAQPGRSRAAAKRAQSEDPKLRVGIALLDAREYQKAAAEFERVHVVAEQPRALFWLGRALQESGQLAGALRAYSAYLKESDASTVQARGVEVLGVIQTLTMQVAIVTVNAPDGSTITVDDVAVGKAPLQSPLYVDVGKRTIGATNGGATASKVVNASEEGRLSVDLLPATTPSPAPEPKKATADALPTPLPTKSAPAAHTAAPASSGVRPLAMAGYGGSVLLAAGSVYFAAKAAHSVSVFEEKKGELGVSRSEIEGAQSDAQLQTGLAIGLGAGALGLAMVTLLASSKSGDAKSASAASATRIVVTDRGVIVAGRF